MERSGKGCSARIAGMDADGLGSSDADETAHDDKIAAVTSHPAVKSLDVMSPNPCARIVRAPSFSSRHTRVRAEYHHRHSGSIPFDPASWESSL
jgi:hypothetical protein